MTNNILYIEPKRLADFDIDMVGNGQVMGWEMAMIRFIWLIVNRKISEDDQARQMVRSYLCDLPHLVEEVRAIRPDLLEM